MFEPFVLLIHSSTHSHTHTFTHSHRKLLLTYIDILAFLFSSTLLQAFFRVSLITATVAPTLAPTFAPTSTSAPTFASGSVSTTVFATQKVNTGQTLTEMQYATFATAFATGMQSVLPGTTIIVTGVTASSRRYLLAAAAVSYTATSTSLSTASIQAGISSTAATTAVTSSLQSAGFSGVVLSVPVFATPAPSSAPVQSSTLSQVSQENNTVVVVLTLTQNIVSLHL